MIFLHKVELFSISHLDDISSWKSFMNVQVSSNLKEKKNWYEGQDDLNPWPKLPLHHTNYPLSTSPLRIKVLKYT